MYVFMSDCQTCKSHHQRATSSGLQNTAWVCQPCNTYHQIATNAIWDCQTCRSHHQMVTSSSLPNFVWVGQTCSPATAWPQALVYQMGHNHASPVEMTNDNHNVPLSAGSRDGRTSHQLTDRCRRSTEAPGECFPKFYLSWPNLRLRLQNCHQHQEAVSVTFWVKNYHHSHQIAFRYQML